MIISNQDFDHHYHDNHNQHHHDHANHKRNDEHEQSFFLARRAKVKDNLVSDSISQFRFTERKRHN